MNEWVYELRKKEKYCWNQIFTEITFLAVVGAQFMARTMAMAILATMAILAWQDFPNCEDAVDCLGNYRGGPCHSRIWASHHVIPNYGVRPGYADKNKFHNGDMDMVC